MYSNKTSACRGPEARVTFTLARVHSFLFSETRRQSTHERRTIAGAPACVQRRQRRVGGCLQRHPPLQRRRRRSRGRGKRQQLRVLSSAQRRARAPLRSL